MRILVTNDDGIDGPGLHALVRALADTGHQLLVVAPDSDHSGASAAIGRFTPDDSIVVGARVIPGAPSVEAYAVAGPPALAVMVARLGGFGDVPELVVSGINPGSNTGRATLHSGTVGAALTGANFGVSGMAVSLSLGADPVDVLFDTAGAVAVAALDWLIAAPVKTVLNLNVPNRPLSELEGVRWARLAPFGTVRATIVEGHSESGALRMELRPTAVELPADTDTALVGAGYVAVSSLVGVSVTAPVDAPDAIAAALDVLPGASSAGLTGAGRLVAGASLAASRPGDEVRGGR